MKKDEKKLVAIKDFLLSAEKSIQWAKKLLVTLAEWDELQKELDYSDELKSLSSYASGPEKIIEGVFTGESMLGSDGNIYPIPQNYASKSLLVQWSKLKATIQSDGKIVYKIIEEIPYESAIGIITKNQEKFQVIANGKTYNVLMASVTFLRMEVGENVIIRIPKWKEATYAVLESKVPTV